jgi:transglutaminase-like putative cysteine protease
MIIMFLFFPRLPTRFWALPESLRQGVTGLSSSMEPGALSSIAQSEAPAFRVSFDDAIPPPEDRYWRGPVFWYTDGRQWSGGPTWQQQAVHRRPSRDEFEVNYEGERIAHTVTLEPHHNRRLLALDVPLRMDRRSYVANDVQWLSPTPINKRARYDAVSLTGAAIQSPHIRERRRALQLPHNIPRRVRELARGWRNQTSDPAELLELARGYYREQDFVYTLNPPRMPRNPTETFLFEAKQGFCEHFASSFALLMRLAGVPTRIVTGYMGGELNPIGNYMVVRQSDAHAWCEVWLPEQGWIRVDPTTESAPERLAGSLLSGAGSGEEGFQFNPFRGAFFRQVEYIFDVINNEWNQWVVGYDFDTQTDLLSRAGIPQPSWRNMMFGFLLVSVLTLALVVTILALRADRPSDITVRAYDRFCRKMARAGFRRKPSEGPSDFARRVVAGRPDLKAEITAITETYIKLRYGTPDTLDQRALLRKVRTFNPGRMSSSQKD